MSQTTLRNGRLCNGDLVDIEIVDTVVRDIRPAGSQPVTGPSEDLDGRLVLPPLVNGHAHLDKTFFGGEWQPHVPGGGVRERIELEKARRATLGHTADERAFGLARTMVEYGTGTLRAHVDIDPDVGLDGLKRMLRLRETFAGYLDVQIVAFPQSGIVSAPGVADLLEEAMRLGADVVGGLDPRSIDGDLDGHLDAVFALADRHGAGIDLHLHEDGPAALTEYRAIVGRVAAYGMRGSVTLSHAYGLGRLGERDFDEIAAAFAEQHISIMTNGPAGPVPPVLELVRRGVNVFSGTDNIRDSWWPFGSGDPLDVARTVAYRNSLFTDEDLDLALGFVTDRAAAALGVPDHGLRAGGPADLVVAGARHAAEAVAAPPLGRDVMRAGRWVSRSSLTTRSDVPSPIA
ncbi:amidohydrolase [Nonomuraea sp. WAC 01424]|uniref:amidohydrolase n=1 Tax=Nonomuraea sp. WAC 01424 TaxID=2203200 RepID=UPI001C8C7DA8|nr:amidohydrolase [Nonomuraea sp. WAC 01424]